MMLHAPCCSGCREVAPILVGGVIGSTWPVRPVLERDTRQARCRCDTVVRTEYVLPVTSPVSQTSFTTHSVQYTQYTLSVHITLSVLMLHTLVVNITSSAQSLLSHNIYISRLMRAVAGTSYAPSELVAPERTTYSPSELVAPEHHLCSIRAGRSKAHQLCSIRASRSRAHHLCSIRASRSRAHNSYSI